MQRGEDVLLINLHWSDHTRTVLILDMLLFLKHVVL